MRLLIITQKIDKKDPVLGFFHLWVEEFSKHCESIIVVCLYKGEYTLPSNVKVLSLGKEIKQSRFSYIKNLYTYIWNERKNYDAVFVHMNQEYIVLAGLIWRLLKKKIYMWRNHHAGSVLTDIAAGFCTHVFCTSRFSYTAKYAKTKIMPVGVDTNLFKKTLPAKPKSVLSWGRIAPSKNIDIFVEVAKQNPDLSFDVYGDALPKDSQYLEDLKANAGTNVIFHKAALLEQSVDIYSSHEFFINLSSSGMYDKTIFEAMACGCIVLASNDNLKGNIPDDLIFSNRATLELSQKLKKVGAYSDQQKEELKKLLEIFTDKHSLKNLGRELFKILWM
jgi:glycosyltransferase involved in cell wall biosynthesis